MVTDQMGSAWAAALDGTDPALVSTLCECVWREEEGGNSRLTGVRLLSFVAI